MTRMNLSLTRPVVSGVALSLLVAGVLLVGCSKEESDPDIIIQQPNAGSTSMGGSGGASGGAAAGGATAGGGATGGDAGAGGGNGCPAMGQVPDAMTGVCACPGFKPDLCETAMVCVKLTEDLEHCGACDNACPAGAACNAGMCTMPPTEVATLTGCMTPRMVMGTGTIYISDSGAGTISSVATTAGSTPTELAAGETMPGVIAVDATNVYWATGDVSTTPPGPGNLRAVPLAGGAPIDLLPMPLDEAARGIAVAGDQLLFTHANDIFKIPTTGVVAGDAGLGGTPPAAITCTPEDVAMGRTPPPLGDPVPGATYVASSNESCTPEGYPAGMATNGTSMIFVIKGREGVEVNSVNGGMYLEMGESQGGLFLETAYIDATHGYWAAGEKVNRASLVGGKTMQQLVSNTLSFKPVTGFTVTATHAYSVDEDGVVQGAAFSTIGPDQEAAPLATGQDGAHELLNDGTNLYWINADCRIMSTPMLP